MLTASNPETVYVGPRRVAVWPDRQPITAVAESIRSTHFDDVRLHWTEPATLPAVGPLEIGALFALLLGAARSARRHRSARSP